ncbi:hypothetical protein SEA_ASHTON_11 [Microbacterium phage Ashton]|uniref:Uncharacterized protein n=2 Tax=Akonivirus akoni TaxID=2845587 RepID=A0A4D6TBL3_9CAUD|nr:hypothetical protein HWC17_gp11 [Microbacterium phage Akoni]QCG78297.1 hypothetical protein SEA_AKONI_11 [Microbacterium phage Akoni]QJD51750.1 hypothetical protein SEA_ASHTON_11 [Microbacterium phage Ashton]
MSNNTDPRYRSGNFDSDSKEIVLFYLQDLPKPVAMYVGCNGEYDGYYDLVANIVGSPLADIVDATPNDIDYEEVIKSLTDKSVYEDHAWNEPTKVTLEKPWTVDPWSGLSINDVQESAFAWLASQVYSRWYDDGAQRRKIAMMLGVVA